MSQVINTGSFVLAAQETKNPWSPKILFTVAIFLFTGTMNTLTYKFQNTYNFQHGILQTALMFLGEYLNLFLFGSMTLMTGNATNSHFKSLQKKATSGGQRKELKVSKLNMGFAAFFDSVGSSLQIVSLLLINPSV